MELTKVDCRIEKYVGQDKPDNYVAYLGVDTLMQRWEQKALMEKGAAKKYRLALVEELRGIRTEIVDRHRTHDLQMQQAIDAKTAALDARPWWMKLFGIEK